MLNCSRSLIVLITLSVIADAADYEVSAVDALPDDVSADVAKALSAEGHQVTGPDGPLCTVWFVKSPSVKEGFKPTLSVKYPLTPGGLVGLLRIDEGTEFADFREQVLEPGLYTLRYGQQPQDGNHIGTSDLADFLLALPAKADTSPQGITDNDELESLSTDAGGSTHPAILSLKPTDDAKPGEAKISHDGVDDLWVLEAAAGKENPVALRLVVVGFALE